MIMNVTRKKGSCDAAFFSRDEATRTPDPYVPNVVRYQLRYIPIAQKRLQSYTFFSNYAHFFLFFLIFVCFTVSFGPIGCRRRCV